MIRKSPSQANTFFAKYRGFATPWIAVLLCASTLVHAADMIEFGIADIKSSHWSAKQIEAAVQFAANKPSGAALEVAEFDIVGIEQTARNISVHCPALEMSGADIGCAGATVTGHWPFLEQQRISADLHYDLIERRVRFSIAGISLAGGKLSVEGTLEEEGWHLTLRGRSIDAGSLLATARQLLEVRATWELAGQLNGTLRVAGTGSAASAIHGTVGVESLSASNEDGTLASDGLTGEFETRLQNAEHGWRLELRVQPVAGQLYLEPVFMDLAVHPFVLRTAGYWNTDDASLALDRFEYEQGSVGHASGSLHAELLPEWSIRQLEAQIGDARMPAAYDIYLSPLLFGTELDTLESTGTFDARMSIENGELQSVAVNLHQVHLDDDQNRFAVYGLDGDLLWRAESELTQAAAEALTSRVRWQGGFVYGVQTGAGEIDFLTNAQDFALHNPVRLPVLDGGLMVNALRIARFGQPDMRIEFDARIEPISLQGLTAALEWPVFGGTLSGTLPRLNYELGELTLGGDLEARVFDGNISIEKLKISEPFGLVPQLSANIYIRGLDLEKVTETFSFGKITGLLDGDVRDLHMLDWEPTAFDARFQTPEGDTSRRRISQRAIENISSLSGQSVTAVLSNGFMRFFDDFAYAELALGCRLESGVCSTGAVLAEGERYYIVRGKGLPRIDVIGYSRRIAWPILIDRLKSINYGEAVID